MMVPRLLQAPNVLQGILQICRICTAGLLHAQSTSPHMWQLRATRCFVCQTPNMNQFWLPWGLESASVTQSRLVFLAETQNVCDIKKNRSIFCKLQDQKRRQRTAPRRTACGTPGRVSR